MGTNFTIAFSFTVTQQCGQLLCYGRCLVGWKRGSFLHPRRDFTVDWCFTWGSQSVTARWWAVILITLESICAVDVASTVRREDGREVWGVEGVGRRRRGRYISRVSTYNKCVKRINERRKKDHTWKKHWSACWASFRTRELSFFKPHNKGPTISAMETASACKRSLIFLIKKRLIKRQME